MMLRCIWGLCSSFSSITDGERGRGKEGEEKWRERERERVNEERGERGRGKEQGIERGMDGSKESEAVLEE